MTSDFNTLTFQSYVRSRRSTRRARPRTRRTTRRTRASRAPTIYRACGVSKTVWNELDYDTRRNLLERKRVAITAALERNIALQSLQGKRIADGTMKALRSLQSLDNVVENGESIINQLARTDH